MAAPRFSITYVDGATVEVSRRPVHWMRAERILPPDAKANETVLASLWASATGGTEGRDAFEAWAETVEDWSPVEASVGGDAVPPATEPAG